MGLQLKDLMDQKPYWIKLDTLGWDIARWDSDDQTWMRIGSDVPMRHAEGDVLEIQGPIDMDDQDEIARLTKLVAKITAERDEADRRAGAAERRLSYLEDTARRTQHWKDNIKEEFGIGTNQSFDRVIQKARDTRDRLKALEEAQPLLADLVPEPGRVNYMVIREALAKLSGRHAMAETTMDHIGIISQKMVDNTEVVMALLSSLTAAVSLLKRSPKTAAPSDKMFDQMIKDYENAIDSCREALGLPKEE